MTSIERICSGGQSGVDRAALDAAIFLGIQYTGWCPLGGWAEDYLNSPGLLTKYPLLRETPSQAPEQRTEWNVKDSDATIILTFGKALDLSPGTCFTADTAEKLYKPYKIIALNEQDSFEKSVNWLQSFNKNILLNVAGPRESESPDIYKISYDFLISLLKIFT